MSEFIFMLTKDDVTVTDARDIARGLGDDRLRYVGFKDVGLPVEALHELVDILHAQGKQVLLEVVSEKAKDELRSVEVGLELGVDYLLGGVNADAALTLLAAAGDSAPLYFPFAGTVVGHPSVLTGTVESIADSAAALTARPGVAGVDLLAYRFTGDQQTLLETVTAKLSEPVIAAGSVDSIERVRIVQEAGPWGFTVGTAAFEGRFHPGGDLSDQLAAILDTCGRDPAGFESTSNR